MKRPILFPSIVACLFLFSTTSAAIFERDLLTPGDGLLTFDDVNKREWLDLSESLLEQFPGDNLEENYQSVVTETGVRGIFEGFSVAKGDDAEALAISAGIDICLIDPCAANEPRATNGSPVFVAGGRIRQALSPRSHQ